MDLSRYYFISDDLDDLEEIEDQLLQSGIANAQTHVLSHSNADVNSHQNLNSVTSFMQRDLVHSAMVGATWGAFAASMILVMSYFAGWTASTAGWLPFIFLALIVLFFFTWIGGFWGIQIPNHHFARFQKLLDRGKHVFFVDAPATQKAVIMKVAKEHPRLKFAGKGKSMPGWIVGFEIMTDSWWYWRMWRNA